MPTTYTRPGREVEVPTPYGLLTAHGYSKPVAAPAAHLPGAERVGFEPTRAMPYLLSGQEP
jgi:hypothetical protein